MTGSARSSVIACDKREAFAQGSAATKQSSLSLRGEMDCFAALAMTERRGLLRGARHCEERSDKAIHFFFAQRDGLLRCARNDGEAWIASSRSLSWARDPLARNDGKRALLRHCLRQTRSVCARERSDEAIQSFFARRDGLLRCARNDGEGVASDSWRSSSHPRFSSLPPDHVTPSLPATNAKRLRKGAKRRSNQ